MLGGFHHHVEGGLAGAGAHGLDGQVGDVHAGLGSQQQRGHLVAGSVVGVELDGNTDLLLEGSDQLLRGIGLSTPDISLMHSM